MFINTPNSIVVKNIKELNEAKRNHLCMYIFQEDNNVINFWERVHGKWLKHRYVVIGEAKEKDDEISGLKAYQSFYYYCGEEEVDKMKHIFSPIPIWESEEQIHYANMDFANQKIYKDIYEFDANSAFTYGTLRLPNGFEKLKEYMYLLYENKRDAKNSITRSKFKNLQNFLIGYFARIKDFVKLRSEIILNSNLNISLRMAEIFQKGGNVYISNTDSIVTDNIGAEIMQKYIGGDVGQFKFVKKVDRLFYMSSNAYQLGDKVTYSGVKYFARQHTDFFKEESAEQYGRFVNEHDFLINCSNENKKLCRISFGDITVKVYNNIGELIKEIIYKNEVTL